MALWVTERFIFGRKAKRRGNSRWELKISYEANQGVTLKGDDIKKTVSGRLPPCCNMGEPERS